METTQAPGLDDHAGQLSLLNTTEDAAEGVGAFLQKRTPHWKGPLADKMVTSDHGASGQNRDIVGRSHPGR
jgi:hypothetical protein